MLKKKKEIRPEDIVILIYAPNPCYTNLIGFDKKSENLEIDFKKRKWKYKSELDAINNDTWLNIGKQTLDYNIKCEGEVIGVFDRSDIEQPDTMNFCAKRATEEDDYSDEY